MKRTPATLFLLLAALPGAAALAADEAPGKPIAATFKPVLLDAGNSQGSTLGLDYDVYGKVRFGRAGNTSVDSPTISDSDVNVVIRTGEALFRARGTVASSKERNPNKLLDFSGSVVWRVDAPAYYLRLGGLLTYETDQGFDDKQSSYALTGSVSKVGSLVAGDAGSLILAWGKVNPTQDKVRQQLLGSMDSFKRWNLEASYSIPVNLQKFRSLDFNYRHYQEVGAPDAIHTAGLDRNRLALVRANFDQDFFLQYSRGSLPFDQKSARTVKMGWSFKLF